MRVGLGRDIHRLIPEGPLVLGGITIDFPMGLHGHSDADVVIHAVIDALLGASGLGDIGEWFPDTDEEWAGANSTLLLQRVVSALQEHNWQIVNLDCTVRAESPRLTPWKPKIRSRLAELLGIAREQVNVKAKSGEELGPVGRGEGIAAEAIVLIETSGSS